VLRSQGHHNRTEPHYFVGESESKPQPNVTPVLIPAPKASILTVGLNVPAHSCNKLHLLKSKDVINSNNANIDSHFGLLF
jgi:hypothetical protein